MIFAGGIYHHEIPSFMKPYLASDAMRRLKHIDMNCGMNYTSFPLFQNIEAYSRFHHSLGCALIVWHFTEDPKQSLSALFHDIATPVFSHVVDFVFGDYVKQEYTENRTAEFIRNDRTIMSLLKKDQIDLSEVCDYHIYPLADNNSPRLCADRLEYIFGDVLDYRFGNENDLQRLYEDLTVRENEDGENELCFIHEDCAAQFALYSLKCGRIYSGDENRFAMEYLADILRDALKQRVIDENDLFTRESEVLCRLRESSLANRLSYFEKMNHTVHTSENDPCGKMIDAKKRCVDPLCLSGKRISAINPEIKEETERFKAVDYHYYVKGIIR